jgi:hypothetical protein
LLPARQSGRVGFVITAKEFDAAESREQIVWQGETLQSLGRIVLALR